MSVGDWGDWGCGGAEGGGGVGVAKLLVGRAGGTTTLTVDKAALAAASTHFAARIRRAFDSTLPEWIVLPDHTPTTIAIILHSITNKEQTFPGLTTKDALEGLAAAKEFGMPLTEQQLTNFLIGALKFSEGDTAVEVLEEGRRLGDAKLQKEAIKYIVPRFSSILKSNAFGKFSRTSISELLRNEDIVVESELDVFKAILSWTELECKKLSIDFRNSIQFQCILGDLKNLIRFPNIKRDDFEKFVIPSGILETYDCELLEHYWKLLETDPVSADAMHLPFEKARRTGHLYGATFFPMVEPKKDWIIASSHWSAIKLQSEASIAIHNITMYGKPLRGKVIPVQTLLLLEVISGGTGIKRNKRYSSVTSLNGKVRVMGDGTTSKLELDNGQSLKLVGGKKYQLKICFPTIGFRGTTSATISGTPWTVATSACGKAGHICLVAKKVKGSDFLLKSIEFALTPIRNKETDTYSVFKAEVKGTIKKRKEKEGKKEPENKNCVIA